MKTDELNKEIAANSGEMVTAKIERNVEVSPSAITIYANDTQLQTSPWDVRFQFGLVQGLDVGKKVITIQHLADIRMSPQHAKRVLEILGQQIATYEKNFGAIPQPEKD
jgi:hypothetical protein